MLFHDGLPVGIGHVGHQHIPCLKLMSVGNTFIQKRKIDTFPRRSYRLRQCLSPMPFRPVPASITLSVIFENLFVNEWFRPGLHNEQLLRQSIHRPFHIHRAPVVLSVSCSILDLVTHFASCRMRSSDRQYRFCRGRSTGMICTRSSGYRHTPSSCPWYRVSFNDTA